jgi:Lrp/AsnC family leucine-responsive transcriptional regulator
MKRATSCNRCAASGAAPLEHTGEHRVAGAGRPVVALIWMSRYGPRRVLRVAAGSIDAFEAVIDRLAPYGRPWSTIVLSTPLGWRPVTPVPASDD